MDHPSQLFSRIRRQKARPDLPRQGYATVAPAPAPIRAAASQSATVDAPQRPAPFRAAATCTLSEDGKKEYQFLEREVDIPEGIFTAIKEYKETH